MDNPTYITIPEAVKLYKQSGFRTVVETTMRNWAKRYGFGLKLGGKWWIDKEKFEQFLQKGNQDDD